MASKWEVIEDGDLVKTFDTLEEALEFKEQWDNLNRNLGLDCTTVIVYELEANDA